MRDDDATQTLPSIAEIQGQVFQAVCDLTTLAAAIKVGTVEVTSEVRATASAILGLILLFNGYFGRSGEWNIMKIEWVLAQIRSGERLVKDNVAQNHLDIKRFVQVAGARDDRSHKAFLGTAPPRTQ